MQLSIINVHTIYKGRKRRMGFGKKGKNSFTVHRSEEVLPGEIRGALSRGSSSEADGGEALADGGAGTGGDRFAKFYCYFRSYLCLSLSHTLTIYLFLFQFIRAL